MIMQILCHVLCAGMVTDSGRRGNYPRGSSPDQYDSRYSQGRGGGSQGSRFVWHMHWSCMLMSLNVIVIYVGSVITGVLRHLFYRYTGQWTYTFYACHTLLKQYVKFAVYSWMCQCIWFYVNLEEMTFDRECSMNVSFAKAERRDKGRQELVKFRE